MSKSQDTKSLAKVTRRAIITGAAATVATYAASRSDAQPPKHTPASEIPDFSSYQALALFLIFTTNPDFFDNVGSKDQQIADRLGLKKDQVTKARQMILKSPNKVNYDGVRDDFQKMAHDVAAYSGGHCPSTPATLGLISKLYIA
jgi:hypothetical protein